jgi:N-acetylglutamate synthase-like GNAT family acetyltransferase
VHIQKFDGDRDNPLLDALLALADDSQASVASYKSAGDLFVAFVDGDLVGELILIEVEPKLLEIKSVAVDEACRGMGVGDGLVEAALDDARARDAERVLIGTATADLDNLGFYQRRGFRMVRVERDAFTPERGYEDALERDGIPVRDRIWLELELS